jgi:putative acetyltransferase
MLALRHYLPADGLQLLALFHDTIRRVNSRDYSPEQIRAWSSDEIDADLWMKRFEGRFVVVGEEFGRIVGFAELEPDGHINRFYVSADHQRCGIGRKLLEALIVEARRLALPRVDLEASITALPFFKAQGFMVEAEQTIICRGVELVNYRMYQDL